VESEVVGEGGGLINLFVPGMFDKQESTDDDDDSKAAALTTTTLVDYHIVVPECKSSETAHGGQINNKHCIYGHSKFIDRENTTRNDNSANIGEKIVKYSSKSEDSGIVKKALAMLLVNKSVLIGLLDSSNYRLNKVGVDLIHALLIRERTKATVDGLLPVIKYVYLLTQSSQNVSVKTTCFRILGLFFTIATSTDCIPEISSEKLCESIQSWYGVWKMIGSEKSPSEEIIALEEMLLNALVWSTRDRLKWFVDEGISTDLIQYALNRLGDGKAGIRHAGMSLECVHRMMKGVEEGSVSKFDALSINLGTPNTPVSNRDKTSLSVLSMFKSCLEKNFKDCGICKARPCTVKNFMEFCDQCKVWKCSTCSCDRFHIEAMDWIDQDVSGAGGGGKKKKNKKGKKAAAEEAAKAAAEAAAEEKKNKKKGKKGANNKGDDDGKNWRDEFAEHVTATATTVAVEIDEEKSFQQMMDELNNGGNLPPPPGAEESLPVPSMDSTNLDMLRGAMDAPPSPSEAGPPPGVDFLEWFNAQQPDAAVASVAEPTTIDVTGGGDDILEMQLREMQQMEAELERMKTNFSGIDGDKEEGEEEEESSSEEEEEEEDGDSDSSDDVEEVLWTPELLAKKM
jgi:hypothetical protein